ncbi:MAG TPA: UDP-4-amino-4,6-dideoxy-N-acetyl-beta-L-altrosamine N-acetyltransferase [Candidatus Limnocylindrales bacterium]
MSETSATVQLRPMSLEDSARVLAWRNLPEVAAFMFTDHVISSVEHTAWFAAALADESRRYWIIELEGKPVGLANLYDISPRQKRAYLGLYLADDRVRGLGVGSATDQFLMRHAFEALGLEKLCAEALATNEAGIRVHQHHGFRIDGVLRRHVIKAGERVDVVTMSLLREEWTDRSPTERR